MVLQRFYCHVLTLCVANDDSDGDESYDGEDDGDGEGYLATHKSNIIFVGGGNLKRDAEA